MQKIYTWNSKKGLQIARATLTAGSIVLADSDTVIGLLAICTKEGFEALNHIKGRQQKPYLILAGSIEQVWEFALPPENEGIKRLISCWPASLTLILPVRPGLPKHLQSPTGQVAIRIPNHKQLQLLALQCGGLFSTSANKTGVSVPTNLADVDLSIQEAAGFVVGNAKKISFARINVLPSTILDCSQHLVGIVREGIYPIAALEKIYGKPFIRYGR